MPTFGDLKAAICGYTNRDPQAFVKHGHDNLLRAVNNAHSYMQRKRVFEHARVYMTVPDVSLTSGGSLDDAVLFGTNTTIGVRSVEKAYLSFSNANDGQFPVDIISRHAWNERMRRRFDLQRSTDVEYQTVPSVPLSVVLFGRTIHLQSADTALYNGATTVDVHFDGVQWFPDLQTASDTDIFVDHAFDFLLYRSIMELNYFLKESERVQVSKTLVDDVWDSVVQWDSTITLAAIKDVTLD